MASRGTGRTSKRTPEREQLILNSLRLGNTRTAAAAYADVDRVTFWRWIQADETFRNAVEKAEGDAEARFLGMIAKAAVSGTWTAAAWWLERRRPESFARTERLESSVELSGPGGKPLGELGELSDHEKRVLRSAIRAHVAERSGDGEDREDLTGESSG